MLGAVTGKGFAGMRRECDPSITTSLPLHRQFVLDEAWKPETPGKRALGPSLVGIFDGISTGEGGSVSDPSPVPSGHRSHPRQGPGLGQTLAQAQGPGKWEWQTQLWKPGNEQTQLWQTQLWFPPPQALGLSTGIFPSAVG